jgi:hypothetical protein
LPEAILGVYSDDELEQFNATDVRVPGDQPAQPPQRGASALKAALAAGAADATDATVITGAEEAATSTPAEKTKPAGTPEERDAFVSRMKACNDTEILALVRDEANGLEWTAPDLAVIDGAYKAKLAALEG